MAEAARIVVPGGRVLVLDLREHEQEWVPERLGDRWLGFSDATLARLLKQAGLTDVKVRSAPGAPAIRSPCSSPAASSGPPELATSR